MIEDLVRNNLSVWLGDQISLDGYVFDAYLRMTHNRKLSVTQHPIESGAAVTDHAFVEPITFELEIGMTDTTLGKIPTQFSGLNLLYTNSSIKSRSVKAYDLLIKMQESRQLYEFVCRYGTFKVVVEEVSPEDDYTTKYALRARVRLRQIIQTVVSQKPISANPQITDSINRGSQNSVDASTNKNVSIAKQAYYELGGK